MTCRLETEVFDELDQSFGATQSCPQIGSVELTASCGEQEASNGRVVDLSFVTVYLVTMWKIIVVGGASKSLENEGVGLDNVRSQEIEGACSFL